MGRDVEHVGVVPEDVLGAVPMMHVPVDDEDPLPECRARGRGDGDIVDQTEAHGPVGGRMMPRRPDRDEGDALAALLECLQGGQPGPCAAPRRRPRVRPRAYVSASTFPAAFRAERRQAGQVGRIVDARQLVHGRLAHLGQHDLVFGSERAHAFHDGDQAGRPLGMTGTAVVLRQPRRPGDDERRHAGPRR